MTRVLICGDLHCGHVAGLTPPGWRINGERFAALNAMQRDGWARWLSIIQDYGPFDVAICNGDLIDGPGERSGGSEEMYADPLEQVEMARACLEPVSPRRGWWMTYGTAYHTGQRSDYERGVAEHFGAEIRSHQWIDIDGVVFDVKHHLGSSSVPHARHTAVARDRIWNLLWAREDRQPDAQVYIRSHVHYHNFAGGPDWLGMTLPALQMAHTKFGARRCSGTVDWGVVVFDIEQGGAYRWQPVITRFFTAESELRKA